jgi:hypothetical protein
VNGKTWRDHVDNVRCIIALSFLGAALEIAPKAEKPFFAKGISRIIREVIQKDFVVTDETSDDDYYPRRFAGICLELGLDPLKVLDPSNIEILPVVTAFSKGELDEVKLMRSLRNLSILNSGKWEKK